MKHGCERSTSALTTCKLALSPPYIGGFASPVTHQVHAAECSCCGKVYRGEFPEGVTASVQYGPEVKAVAVHLSTYQMLPVKRKAELIDDLFGLPISEATVISSLKEASELVQPTVDAIGDAILKSKVVNADETGMRVAGGLHWIHLLTTPLLTGWRVMPSVGKKRLMALVYCRFFWVFSSMMAGNPTAN